MTASFQQAAATYDDAATIQSLCFNTLLEEIKKKQPKRILDIGCGTGKNTRLLAQHFPDSVIVAIDQSSDMIKLAKECHSHPNVDYRVEPFRTDLCLDFDLIFSNATVQWFEDPRQTLLDIESLPHTPDVAISFFVQQTYQELKTFFPESELYASRFLASEKVSFKGTDWSIFKTNSQLLFSTLKELFLHMRHTGVQGTQKQSLTPSQFRHIDRQFLDTYGQYKLTYDAVFCIRGATKT